MYPCNIDFSLKILGLFIVINVVRASLNKNQTSISKDNTTTQRGIESSDHGELENSLLMQNTSNLIRILKFSFCLIGNIQKLSVSIFIYLVLFTAYPHSSGQAWTFYPHPAFVQMDFFLLHTYLFLNVNSRDQRGLC